MKTYTYKVGRFEFIVNCTKGERGIFTCHIPAYDIFFNGKDEEQIEKKAKGMMQMWFNFFGIK